MGIIHKLRPEVRDFIVEQKKAAPALSCRSLTALILEQFQIQVSKSSINAIFKENNLSMPIGRRPKQKKKKFNMPALPIIESVKAVMLIEEPVINLPLQKIEGDEAARKAEQERLVEAARKIEEQRIIEEAAKKAEEEKLLREAQEQARQAAEEAKRLEEEAVEKAEQERQAKEAQEQARREAEEAQRLEAEVAKKAEQARLEEAARKIEEQRIIEEAAKKAEEEKLLREAQEQARQAAEEAKRLEEEAELKIEREKWAKLAEEELKSKQLAAKAELNAQKDKAYATEALPSSRICSGAIFLRAIDKLIGGSKQINEIICDRMGKDPKNFVALTEAVIFKSLFASGDLLLLSSLVGQQIAQENLDNYCAEIKQIKTIRLDIARIIANVFTQVRGVKVHFIDGSIVYLDGQLHTLWQTPYSPHIFADAIYNLKGNLNKCFFQSQPLVFLTAPGYDSPTKEFFNLLLNLNSADKKPDRLTLYGDKLEDLETISLNSTNNYSFVFGLWPWQFMTSRKIKKIGDFKPEKVEGVEKELYLAEIEVDLLSPSTNQSAIFRGCAVKTDLKEKIRVVILSSDRNLVDLNKMAQIYLNHWPNLEEGFGDFSRKVEVFTYAGSTHNFFSTEDLGLSKSGTSLELEEAFANYIKILDAYLRWHFLPAEFIGKDMSFMNQNLYESQVKLTDNQVRVTAQMPIKDLEYLLHRLNERRINFGPDKVFYFENAFK